MEIKLPYIEALLLEEISRGRAEVLLNKVPTVYYVNDRQADESIIPILESLYNDGLLDMEKPFEDVFYYSINHNGKQVLDQSLALATKPC